MKKNNKKIIWLGFILSLFFFVIFIFTKDLGQNITSTSPLSTIPPVQSEEKAQAFLEIEGKRLETTVKEKENVYDFMVKLRREGKINFKDKTYTGMGKLIEEINGLKNTSDNYWIYYVNGEKAQVGVLDYKINPGDIVSWKYEENRN